MLKPTKYIYRNVVIAILLSGCSPAAKPSIPKVGLENSFSVGGIRLAKCGGDKRVGAWNVEVRNPGGKVPAILLPGGGLSGKIYEQTIDGRAGWAGILADYGYKVFIVERSYSHFGDICETRPAPPNPDPVSLWTKWGAGPVWGERFDNTQFPDVDPKLIAQYAIATPSPKKLQSVGKNANAVALKMLLARTGPAIIIAHSAGGVESVETMRLMPEKVKALILVETVGCSGNLSSVDVPVLGMAGDHLEVRPHMIPRMEACRKMIKSSGNANSKFVALPDEGIGGNTHIPMADLNNNKLAEIVLEWLSVLRRENSK